MCPGGKQNGRLDSISLGDLMHDGNCSFLSSMYFSIIEMESSSIVEMLVKASFYKAVDYVLR